ncbi:FliH/SctL family protein [Sphingomonas crocodyli]|uniref:Uncharacterized protein n=1 Tax=Sphingomonas crocodyli TaxID=1979270 RepID=A0A437M6D1_9SPHN|nr:FliH/SctL family protein [Sphingomonas crocodyli]RVT93281.1 hypothetical protein EOD43_05170 [Sphingomonas crocodyli]
MTFIVVHADQAATLLADDPLISAHDMRSVNGALDLFGEAGLLRQSVHDSIEAARFTAREEGKAEGLAEGRATAEEEGRAELFRLAMRDGEERRKRQSEIASIALEVVRRIAGDIGDPAFVAGLAERAAAALAPETAATIRVPPAAFDAVTARVAHHNAISVEADPTLEGTDCVVETALGRTLAGLDTQIAQIEAAWKDAARHDA